MPPWWDYLHLPVSPYKAVKRVNKGKETHFFWTWIASHNVRFLMTVQLYLQLYWAESLKSSKQFILKSLTLFVWNTYQNLSFYFCFFQVLFPSGGRRERSRYSDFPTGWTVRGSNSGGGEIFRTCPERPWGLPSLLYNGGKTAWAWRWPFTPHWASRLKKE